MGKQKTEPINDIDHLVKDIDLFLEFLKDLRYELSTLRSMIKLLRDKGEDPVEYAQRFIKVKERVDKILEGANWR